MRCLFPFFFPFSFLSPLELELVFSFQRDLYGNLRGMENSLRREKKRKEKGKMRIYRNENFHPLYANDRSLKKLSLQFVSLIKTPDAFVIPLRSMNAFITVPRPVANLPRQLLPDIMQKLV